MLDARLRSHGFISEITEEIPFEIHHACELRDSPLHCRFVAGSTEAELEAGSPGGTRTPDQLVTSALTFLPGLDYLITRRLTIMTGVGRYRGLLVGVLNL